MKRLAAVLLLFSPALLAARCDPDPPDPVDPVCDCRGDQYCDPNDVCQDIVVPFTVYRSGITSGINDRQELHIPDAVAFQNYWNRLTTNQFPQPPAPQDVDFTTHELIALHMGVRRTGGYSIGVDSIDRNPDRRQVDYTETSPGQGCRVTQAFTSPYVVVKVRKLPEALQFVRHAEVRHCE